MLEGRLWFYIQIFIFFSKSLACQEKKIWAGRAVVVTGQWQWSQLKLLSFQGHTNSKYYLLDLRPGSQGASRNYWFFSRNFVENWLWELGSGFCIQGPAEIIDFSKKIWLKIWVLELGPGCQIQDPETNSGRCDGSSTGTSSGSGIDRGSDSGSGSGFRCLAWLAQPRFFFLAGWRFWKKIEKLNVKSKPTFEHSIFFLIFGGLTFKCKIQGFLRAFNFFFRSNCQELS